MFLPEVHLFLSRAGWPGTGTGSGGGACRGVAGQVQRGLDKDPRAGAPAAWVAIATFTGHLHVCRSRFLFSPGNRTPRRSTLGGETRPDTAWGSHGLRVCRPAGLCLGVLPRPPGPDAQCAVRTRLQSAASRPRGEVSGWGPASVSSFRRVWAQLSERKCRLQPGPKRQHRRPGAQRAGQGRLINSRVCLSTESHQRL